MSRARDLCANSVVQHAVEDAIEVSQRLLSKDVAESVEAVATAIIESFNSGGKILLCGNGGSAADAQHLAAEFVGRFRVERKPLPAIALADNIAAMTAVANDFSYDEVFTRSVRALGQPDDILVGMSTSGASSNVIAALEAGNAIGLTTAAFVGTVESPMAKLATHVLCVQGPDTARIQEGHMLLGHTICEVVERRLCTPL